MLQFEKYLAIFFLLKYVLYALLIIALVYYLFKRANRK